MERFDGSHTWFGALQIVKDYYHFYTEDTVTLLCLFLVHVKADVKTWKTFVVGTYIFHHCVKQ